MTNGIYQIIHRFTNPGCKVELAEHVCQMTEHHRSIRHELHFTPKGQPTIVLDLDEVIEMGRLMIEAVEAAKRRTEGFYAEDEVTTTV